MGDREQKRQRLDNLTVAMQDNIDEGVSQIEALDVAIAESLAAIAAVQAEIDTLVAVPNRNATQNVELRSLRKDIALWRALLASQRLNKKLVRNDMVISRFGLFLDGSRVRDADLSGSK